MKSIRIDTRKLAERRKNADLGVMGGPAKMIFENFETLNGFKPSLDLLGAQNHEPPNMSNSNTPNGISLNNDPEVPTDSDISGNASDFPDSVKMHNPPHENQSVEQNNNNMNDKTPVTAKDLRAWKNSDGDNVNPDGVVAPQKTEMDEREDFKYRYRLAQKIAEIKIASGIVNDLERDEFIDSLVDNQTTDQVEAALRENEAMYEQLKTARKEASTKTSSAPSIPSFTMGGPSVKKVDDLDAIMSGM